MAYSRKVREAARRYWLLGYSDEKILPILKADFPEEKTPARAKTLQDWRNDENWQADLEVIAQKASEKRTEELATELASMSARQLALFGLLDSHIQLTLTVRMVKRSGKPTDTELTPSEIAQIASALERSTKSQRLIRGVPTTQAQVDSTISMDIDVSQLTDEQLEQIVGGEDPQSVLRRKAR